MPEQRNFAFLSSAHPTEAEYMEYALAGAEEAIIEFEARPSLSKEECLAVANHYRVKQGRKPWTLQEMYGV
ncbi:hypothetical protein AGMMS49991_07790 [Spirochaetia bacterium]|nr:hypothetical protein AGMMS49991_07790 [Spirochaetia bacterium]